MPADVRDRGQVMFPASDRHTFDAYSTQYRRVFCMCMCKRTLSYCRSAKSSEPSCDCCLMIPLPLPHRLRI